MLEQPLPFFKDKIYAKFIMSRYRLELDTHSKPALLEDGYGKLKSNLHLLKFLSNQ